MTGKFISADTLIPQPGNLLAWDRCGYAYNNPVIYNDPCGHCINGVSTWACLLIVGLKVIDYGWTGYDSINALIVALNPNESRDARIEGLQTAVIAVGLEIIEPDGDLLPIDDLIRHGDDIVRLTDNVEEQIHHFMTNKNSKYTPKFEKIAQDFKLELDEAWNKGLLPHKGRHPNDYHDWVFTQVREITSELSSCKTNCSEKFVNLFYEKVVQPVINNPDMLRRKFWKEIE